MTFNWGKYHALKKKREEREKIQRLGGGHEVAKMVMSKSTDFNYGANVPQEPNFCTSCCTTHTGGLENCPVESPTNPDTGGCMGRVVCQVCKKFHGYCVEVHNTIEESKMLPTGNEFKQSGGSNGRRQSNQVWLKNENLGTDVREALIHDVRYNPDGRYGARVELKLIMQGKTLFWGIPPKVSDQNPNYKELLDAFGPDENNWCQKRIGLFLEQDAWSGNYFPRVVILENTEDAQPAPEPAAAPAKPQRTSRGTRG